jgi:hypothetical protein
MSCRADEHCEQIQRMPGKQVTVPAKRRDEAATRTQQRPKAFHRIDMDFAKAVAIFITGVLGLSMIDRFMGIAPGIQLVVNGVFIGKNECAGLDSLTDEGLNGLLLDIGKHPNNDFSTALDHAEDGGFSLSSVPRPGAPFNRRRRPGRPCWRVASGCPLCPATTYTSSHSTSPLNSTGFFFRDAFPQLRGHILRHILINVQLCGNLCVGQI